jgi:O-antigen ligase
MPHSYSERLLNISRVATIVAVVVVPFSTALTSIAITIMLLTWLVSGQVLHTLQCSMQQPTGKMLVVFLVVLVLGCSYGNASWQEKLSTLGSWRKFFYPLIFLGIFSSYYWQRLFLKSFLITMVIALLLTYMAWFEIIPSRPGNLNGILANNHTTQSLAFLAAVVYCIYLMRLATFQQRLVLAILIVLFSLNILFVSSSRSGYLALIVGGGFAALEVYGKRWLPQLLILVLVVVAAALFGSKILQFQLKHGYTEVTNYQHNKEFTPMGARVLFWDNTLELIKKRPVFGYGTGSFLNEYSQHVAPKYNDWRATPTGDPHNQYLYILLENGVPGLLVFLAFIVVTIYQGLKTQPYGVIGASVLVAWTATSLFNSHFKTFPEGHMLCLFLGVLLARRCQASEIHPRE